MNDLLKQCKNEDCNAWDAADAIKCECCDREYPFTVKSILACIEREPVHQARRMFPEKPRCYIRAFADIRAWLWAFISYRTTGDYMYVEMMERIRGRLPDYADTYLLKLKSKVNRKDVQEAEILNESLEDPQPCPVGADAKDGEDEKTLANGRLFE